MGHFFKIPRSWGEPPPHHTLPHPPSLASVVLKFRKAWACSLSQVSFPGAESILRGPVGTISLFSCFRALKFSSPAQGAGRRRKAPAREAPATQWSLGLRPGCSALLSWGLPDVSLLPFCSLKLHKAGCDSLFVGQSIRFVSGNPRTGGFLCAFSFYFFGSSH